MVRVQPKPLGSVRSGSLMSAIRPFKVEVFFLLGFRVPSSGFSSFEFRGLAYPVWGFRG